MIIRNYKSKFSPTRTPKDLSEKPSMCKPLSAMDARQFLHSKANGLISVKPEYSDSQIFQKGKLIDDITRLNTLKQENKEKISTLKKQFKKNDPKG